MLPEGNAWQFDEAVQAHQTPVEAALMFGSAFVVRVAEALFGRLYDAAYAHSIEEARR